MPGMLPVQGYAPGRAPLRNSVLAPLTPVGARKTG